MNLNSLNDISITTVVDVIHTSTIYIIFAVVIAACLALLFFINKKSKAYLIWAAVAFIVVGAILSAFKGASDYIVTNYISEYAAFAKPLVDTLVSKFSLTGYIFLGIGAVCIVVFIVLKVKKPKTKVAVEPVEEIEKIAE